MKTLALLFPGQGSQAHGMLAEFYRDHQEVRDLFKLAQEILGYDLWDIICNESDERLDQTEFTQPAMLVADYAVWQVWQKKVKQQPVVVAGHSLGEYAALAVSGILSIEDAIHVVAKRAQFMQQAMQGKQGAMAAIVGLSDEDVQALCEQASTDNTVTPANYNTPGQVVIAGDEAAVDRAIQLAEQLKARMAKKIKVSVPAHSHLMLPAAQQLTTILESVKIHSPSIPVINNVDVALYQEKSDIIDGLTRQVYSPVQWVATAQKMLDFQINAYVECGPGKVLSKLVKRIASEIPAYSIYDNVSLAKFLEQEGIVAC